MISRRAAVRTLLLAFAMGGAVPAQAAHGGYYVVVWGYEGPGAPEAAHTFATFYRGGDFSHGATISWLPATGIVQPHGVERGRNFSLGATLALARSNHRRVAAFGPYEITADTYAHALARIGLLNSGKVAYTMINGPAGAMNCIEAAGSVGGPIDTGLSYGFAASRQVASHLAANSGQVDHEAAAKLHLDAYGAYASAK